MDLYERKRELEKKIKNYFDGEEIHYGDRGYQDLLEQQMSVEMEIQEESNDY